MTVPDWQSRGWYVRLRPEHFGTYGRFLNECAKLPVAGGRNELNSYGTAEINSKRCYFPVLFLKVFVKELIVVTGS